MQAHFTLDQATHPDNLLIQAVGGSHAYGLATPSSDVDLRGIFMLPKEDLFGLRYTEQVSDEKSDIVYYELRRFFGLALQNNPNILELLAVPEDCIKFRHPIMDRLSPALFLSKLSKNTFMGYATQQISKARGMNKKIVNPMAKERKSILEFCYIAKEGKAEPLSQWLDTHNLVQKKCGLVRLDHMRDMYALYYDADGHKGFQGVAQKPYSNEVSLSSVPKGEELLTYISFNKDGYSRYCKEYVQYWDWVEKRNEARYAQTEAHGKGYDAKNIMHCFRLLDMAAEIAQDGIIGVRRPNRDELLEIRSGAHDFDELIIRAETKMKQVQALFEQSSLPDRPDYDAANKLLAEMREDWYER
ncbi:MAG: nucleotidyltransferase domain-containing protein [Bacteroidia bacterium]